MGKKEDDLTHSTFLTLTNSDKNETVITTSNVVMLRFIMQNEKKDF